MLLHPVAAWYRAAFLCAFVPSFVLPFVHDTHAHCTHACTAQAFGFTDSCIQAVGEADPKVARAVWLYAVASFPGVVGQMVPRGDDDTSCAAGSNKRSSSSVNSALLARLFAATVRDKLREMNAGMEAEVTAMLLQLAPVLSCRADRLTVVKAS